MTGGGAAENAPGQSTPDVDVQRVSLLWATQVHAPAIARLHGEIFELGWDEAAIAALLLHPASLALVATDAHPMEIGGFVLAQIAADEAEILTLGTASAWRGRGVGTRLVDGIKRASARAGANALLLEVAASNAAALRLYGRTGFIEVGRRKGYYAATRLPPEDALIMRCELQGAG